MKAKGESCISELIKSLCSLKYNFKYGRGLI